MGCSIGLAAKRCYVSIPTKTNSSEDKHCCTGSCIGATIGSNCSFPVWTRTNLEVGNNSWNSMENKCLCVNTRAKCRLSKLRRGEGDCSLVCVHISSNASQNCQHRAKRWSQLWRGAPAPLQCWAGVMRNEGFAQLLRSSWHCITSQQRTIFIYLFI